MCARCPPPPSSPAALRARERRREPSDRARDPALPGARGPAAGGPDRHRAGAGGGVRRLPPDAARGPAAARLLAPDPRRARPRGRDLRRPHARRGHEPQRQRVDLDDAGDREHLAGQLLDARMFLEVPLAGLAAANARRGDRGRRCRRRSTTPPATSRDAAVQRRRQALPPDPRPRRRQRAAAGVHRLDPRGAAAAADREHLRARGRRRDPAPARATSSARSSAVSQRRRRRRCARTSRTCATFSEAADCSSSGAQLPLLDRLDAARAERDRHAGGDVVQPVLAVEQHARDPLLAVVARASRRACGRAPAPLVQVEERLESSATWRRYQPRMKSSAARAGQRPAGGTHAAEDRHRAVAVLAQHPHVVVARAAPRRSRSVSLNV